MGAICDIVNKTEVIIDRLGVAKGTYTRPRPPPREWENVKISVELNPLECKFL